MGAEITANGMQWPEPLAKRQEDDVSPQCQDKDCRTELWSAIRGKLGLWTAGAILVIASGIIGTCFALVLSARSEAGEAVKTSACQARDIEYLTRAVDAINAKLDRLLDEKK